MKKEKTNEEIIEIIEKEIFKDIKERVKKTRKEDKRLSQLRDKMEKSLTIEEKKELDNINFDREHNLQASLFDFGFISGYESLKENILKLIDEDIELARQSGYNEACFVFEERVKKLKHEIRVWTTEAYFKKIEEIINKIMGSYNHSRHALSSKSSKTSKVRHADNHSPQKVVRNAEAEDTSKDKCEDCEHYAEFNGEMVCNKDTLESGDLPFLVEKDYSCKKFKPLKKGCGKIFQIENEDGGVETSRCDECGLCPACSGEGK